MIKDGIFEFDKITVVPNMISENIEKNDIFNEVKLDNEKFYLAKEKLKLGNMFFWIRITAIDGSVKKFELRNADEKYKMNYSNMTSKLLEGKFESHNNFLIEQIGKNSNNSLGGREYILSWGSIWSFLDIKTGDCGIYVKYN